MKKYLVIAVILSFSVSLFAQDSTEKGSEALAKHALKAHGGAKFKNMKTLAVRGAVDVTAMGQAIPASFITIFSGEKYLLEINNPFQPFKQVYDGEETYTSVQRGFMLPPINRIGFPLLQRLGDEGFEVSDLPKKKKKGFRLTSPEGYYTDFYLDEKTNKVKSYDSSYMLNGREVTTSVKIHKFETKEDIVLPKTYSQRFDMGQMVVYAKFKSKEILINTKIADDVFTLD